MKAILWKQVSAASVPTRTNAIPLRTDAQKTKIIAPSVLSTAKR